MSDVLKNRDFLKEIDFTRDELQHLIDLAGRAEDGQEVGSQRSVCSPAVPSR